MWASKKHLESEDNIRSGESVLVRSEAKMTPGAQELTILGANNNVMPLIPRSTVEIEFKNITCSVNTFTMNKLRFGEF